VAVAIILCSASLFSSSFCVPASRHSFSSNTALKCCYIAVLRKDQWNNRFLEIQQWHRITIDCGLALLCCAWWRSFITNNVVHVVFDTTDSQDKSSLCYLSLFQQ
jgi:hypothetical protein